MEGEVVEQEEDQVAGRDGEGGGEDIEMEGEEGTVARGEGEEGEREGRVNEEGGQEDDEGGEEGGEGDQDVNPKERATLFDSDSDDEGGDGRAGSEPAEEAGGRREDENPDIDADKDINELNMDTQDLDKHGNKRAIFSLRDKLKYLVERAEPDLMVVGAILDALINVQVSITNAEIVLGDEFSLGMIVRRLRKHADSDVSSKSAVLYHFFLETVKTEKDRRDAEERRKNKREREKEEKKKAARESKKRRGNLDEYVSGKKKEESAAKAEKQARRDKKKEESRLEKERRREEKRKDKEEEKKKKKKKKKIKKASSSEDEQSEAEPEPEEEEEEEGQDAGLDKLEKKLKAELAEIIRDADLENFTKRQCKASLIEKFSEEEVDSKKAFINQMIEELVNAKTSA